MPEVITSGRVLPRSAWPRSQDRLAVFLAVSGKAAEVVVEGGMDHRVGVPDASQQRLRGIQRAAMHLGAGRLQGLCGAFAAREADNLMARRLQRRKNT